MTALKEFWAAGRTAYGVWSGLDDPVAVETIGRSGFDFVVIDLQHGFASMASSPALLSALAHTRSIPVVRVPWNTPHLIMRALDLGAGAVIVPLVNDGTEAALAADACRYAPAGNRSWGPLWTNPGRTPIEAAAGDEKATCIAMIETAAGFANRAEIAATDGIHALYVGPNDLSLSIGLGRTPHRDSPELHAAIAAIIDAAHAAGIAAGVDCSGAEDAQHWCDLGADFVISYTDTVLLRTAAESAARAVHTTSIEGTPS